MNLKNRAGIFVRQPSGYQSFVPTKLPPLPNIEIDVEMQRMLSEADRKLGRLDGVTQVLPNPDIFVAMYVQKEALLSSQIEGTQASLTDVLDIDEHREKNYDVQDVVNYVMAMNYGLKRLETLPLSLRLLREIHEVLLEGVRGSNQNPGEFRKSQNWIGPTGCGLEGARFVPPTVNDMQQALYDFEDYMTSETYMNTPSLIRIALLHTQFETIHPFLDGNGRVGRLLITFWLCNEKILSQPLLYLSYYFKLNRVEYYDRLMEVREKGDFEGWIKFFLQGISMVADETVDGAKQILQLQQHYRDIVTTLNNHNSLKLLDYLFLQPIVSRKMISDKLIISSPTTADIVEKFVTIGILKDITPEKYRNKKYRFEEYFNILNRGIDY